MRKSIKLTILTVAILVSVLATVLFLNGEGKTNAALNINATPRDDLAGPQKPSGRFMVQPLSPGFHQ